MRDGEDAMTLRFVRLLEPLRFSESLDDRLLDPLLMVTTKVGKVSRWAGTS